MEMESKVLSIVQDTLQERMSRPLDSDEEEIADGLRGFRNWNISEM